MTPPIEAASPWPLEIRVERGARRLTASFDDGARFALDAALLRALTPSAAERGHGGDPGPLAHDFTAVGIVDARPVGAYAVRLVFDDGHDSGLYTWDALYRMGRDQEALWTEYRRRLAAA